MRLLFPESDEDNNNDDSDNGSRKKNDNAAALSLFRSVIGENLMMRWDRSPPDRHTTSMNLNLAAEEEAEDWNWVQLFKLVDSEPLFKKPQQCPLRADYLRNSFSILSGFA